MKRPMFGLSYFFLLGWLDTENDKALENDVATE